MLKSSRHIEVVMKRIGIFASGSGTNTENIVEYFRQSKWAIVEAIFCNNTRAGVIDRAHKLEVPHMGFKNKDLENKTILRKLKEYKVDLIVLAGFLRKIPSDIIKAYRNRIINIHPALLPDYGGRGMYGIRVHRAIIENEEKKTGITIHYVNEEYDEGDIIFKKAIEIDAEDTPEDVQYKVQQLEYKHYPQVIEYLLNNLD